MYVQLAIVCKIVTQHNAHVHTQHAHNADAFIYDPSLTFLSWSQWIKCRWSHKTRRTRYCLPDHLCVVHVHKVLHLLQYV